MLITNVVKNKNLGPINKQFYYYLLGILKTKKSKLLKIPEPS